MINIMFAGNKKVFDGMLINIISMKKHTKSKINVICMTMNLTCIEKNFEPITNEQIKFLEEILKETNSKSTIKLFDITKLFLENMKDSVNIKSKFTPYSMLRLFADKIPGIPNKIIYLDTDTIINNDISELYNIDINDFEVGCVKDAFNWASPSRWKMMKTYFNAGVILLNMKKIKSTGMLEKARNLCRYKKMLYFDQDALNRSVKYRKMLPLKFNAKDKWFKEIVIHHFCNVRKKSNWFYRIKPWEIDLVKSKMSAYNDILDQYLEKKKAMM